MRVAPAFELLLGLYLFAWAASVPSAAPSGWQIVSRREFSLEEVRGMPHSISPDGAWLLTLGHEACLYSTEDLSLQGCYQPEPKSEAEGQGPILISTWAIDWAPDGKRLAFSTSGDRLWLLAVEEGRLEWLPTSVGGFPVPAWSPNGERLAVGGGGVIVVAPPGALAEAEAPVARYEGILAGLDWSRSGRLVYGLITPDRKSFQLWEADPTGRLPPTLLWSGVNLNVKFRGLSPDGRYAWIGRNLVDLGQGEIVDITAHAPVGFAFSPDGGWWLYAYWAVVKDGKLRILYRLAVRPAGAPEDEEQVLVEDERPIALLGWSETDAIGLFFYTDEPPTLLLLELAPEG